MDTNKKCLLFSLKGTGGHCNRLLGFILIGQLAFLVFNPRRNANKYA
jgi:hypothetical protein